ncbi:hypothetical protein [Natrinema hispanicum]|uniref:Uncharacterized protein n=1 Tax=Natrinema hispanicum TaxID=392421 RepID=A0A1I0J3B9_9EURY|nr:hypothetical protein [Natrinema hispanicum]SDD51189.1 hypothetical protein SAMN05192552_102734 [Natrinema hispanicum]SEU04213.1 hypothetical protein SAMN04488694_1318 [Natrinema hispanicum]
MTEIQQVLWELRMDYIGHPYYVSGNAILHALGQHLDVETHGALSVSHGVFVPGQFGTFPEEHSQSGIRPYLGSGLPDVETYDDLFLQREAMHPWMLDTRARDALNTHDLRVHGGHPTLAHETIMGRREDQRKQQQTTKWYVHAYLHADDPAVLPLGEDVLEGLQFGGKRNYGYGEVQLKDTQMVDLDGLDYSRLEGAETYLIELVTPFVLKSEYSGVNDRTVPWWWAENRDDLRLRQERILEQREVFRLETVDHGQVVKYLGDRPVETAENGLTRLSSHSRYGFGELRLKPLVKQ